MKCCECENELTPGTEFICGECKDIFCLKHEAFKDAKMCVYCNALRQ